MTSSVGKLINYLADSSLTAEFQRKCGISHHSSLHSNGVNGNAHAGTGILKTNQGSDDSTLPGSCTDSTNNIFYKNGTILHNNTEPFGPFNASDKHADNSLSNGSHISNGHNHNNTGLKERKLNNVQPKNGFTKFAHNRHEENGKDNDNHVVKNGYTNQVSNGHSHFENLTASGLNNNSDSVQQDSSNSKNYKIDNMLFYYLFSFGASLGNEIFYILFFSSSLWSFDNYIVRRLLIVWGVIMYVGQAAKDVICWPRPKSPPVFRLEERYELEYGMPSTHAMVGVAIPFSLLFFMTGRYEFNYMAGILIAVVWSALVSVSRLYLGMHSVLDILAGLISAAALMMLTVPLVEPIDSLIITHPYSLPLMVLMCIILSLMYPSLEKWSTARGDTIMVLGVFSGIYGGLWLTGKLIDFKPLPESLPLILTLPSLETIWLALLRQVLGVAFIIIFLQAVKMSVLYGLSWYFGYDPKDPKTKQVLVIELPYKYLSYFIGGVVSTYLMPVIFLKLNIDRPSYYSEIFNYSV
ncbi:unnamed protein product [Lymnaea stagnalis]|uniref:Phosphatidic acid phosphatase type 2/haloperoxidase domain-containing protein n=1 Tax=Lymnaea stagnalis TaxID=6523 RepID=A0AAV2IPL6_LYMST